MKKIAIIILLTITGLSCSDTINEMLDELNAAVPVCVAFDSTAIAPDGRGWANAYTTIGSAVNDPRTPDGAEIWVKAGTYNLSAILTIAKSVSIYGGFNGTEKRRNERSNNNQITIISQTLAGNILFDDTSAGKTILLDCFTIKGNHIEIILGASPAFNNCRFDKITYNGNGGALNMDDSSVTISQCLFNTCEASTGSGGAIYANNNAILNIIRSTFTGNTAATHGGAIYANTASLNIVNSTFTSNVASSASSNGGAIYAQNSSISVSNCSFTANLSNYSSGSNGGGAMYISSTSLNISNTSFADNVAQIHGGAIYVASNSTVAISNNSEFTSNSADNGGAIYAEGVSIVMNIADSYFGLPGQDTTGNSVTSAAGHYGGAIVLQYGFQSLNIYNSYFYYNKAPLGSGGALYIYDSTVIDDAYVIIENSTFQGNSANADGGAIIILNGNSPKITISNTNFIGNSSDHFGGAIACSAGELKVNDCIFNGNKSTAQVGGGLFLQYGNLYSIVNTVFYNNSALGGSGGAIYYTTSSATHRFVNLTFYNNSATGNGGAIYAAITDLYLYNTIIFGTGNCIHKNDPGTLFLNNCYYNSTLTSSGGSTVPNTGCVDSSSNPFVSTTSTEIYFLYPNNTAGARNSGTTNTAVLPSGFIMPATDLAGNPRVVGDEVDMGAYEAQ